MEKFTHSKYIEIIKYVYIEIIRCSKSRNIDNARN
nr:MAG TPA: hypothetical protein [Bacteriophage sp.]